MLANWQSKMESPEIKSEQNIKNAYTALGLKKEKVSRNFHFPFGKQQRLCEHFHFVFLLQSPGCSQNGEKNEEGLFHYSPIARS